jgi:hypothetical protein
MRNLQIPSERSKGELGYIEFELGMIYAVAWRAVWADTGWDQSAATQSNQFIPGTTRRHCKSKCRQHDRSTATKPTC